MKIRKFNESSDDEISWIRDFIDDLELDFPGIETEFNDDIEPTGEIDTVKINLPCKKEPSPNGSTWITLMPDDEIGWSRRDLLKYIENKVNFLTDSVEGLDLYQYLLIPFADNTKSLSIYNGDISSSKFINKIKLPKLERLQKITIKFYITG